MPITNWRRNFASNAAPPCYLSDTAMSLFQIATLLMTLSALFSYVNFLYLRLPTKLTS